MSTYYEYAKALHEMELDDDFRCWECEVPLPIGWPGRYCAEHAVKGLLEDLDDE